MIGAWIAALVLASPQAIIFRWPHQTSKKLISVSMMIMIMKVTWFVSIKFSQGPEAPRQRFLSGEVLEVKVVKNNRQ